VWRNTVAQDPTLEGVGYQTFFAVVRAVNLSLAPDLRIRVLLGEPPIDWSSIHTREAWQRIYAQREEHAAKVIVREILDRGKKALVIYGTAHFYSTALPVSWQEPATGLAEIVERSHPNAFYRVAPYGGYKVPGCSAALEAQMKWPKRVLISPIRGTALEAALMRPECMQKMEQPKPAIPAEELARFEKRSYEIDTGVLADALLYIAPAEDLKRTPQDPAIWMDPDYDRELHRRYLIRRGEPLHPLIDDLRFYAMPPQPWTWQ